MTRERHHIVPFWNHFQPVSPQPSQLVAQIVLPSILALSKLSKCSGSTPCCPLSNNNAGWYGIASTNLTQYMHQHSCYRSDYPRRGTISSRIFVFSCHLPFVSLSSLGLLTQLFCFAWTSGGNWGRGEYRTRCDIIIILFPTYMCLR